MWIEDLQPFDSLVPNSRRYLRAVGWLSKGHNYQKGDVDSNWFLKLCELLQNPWVPPVISAGIHRCEFCRFTGGSETSFKEQYRVPSGSNLQLFIPGSGVLYVLPVSAAHYIDSHEYAPPQEFRDAVASCPPMRSMQYMRQLLDNGGRELLEGLKDLGNLQQEQQ